MTNSAYAKNKGDGLLCSILWPGGEGQRELLHPSAVI